MGNAGQQGRSICRRAEISSAMVLKLRVARAPAGPFPGAGQIRPAAERLRRRSHGLQRANNALDDEERREKTMTAPAARSQHHGPGGRCTAVRGKPSCSMTPPRGSPPDQVIALKQTDGREALTQGAFKGPGCPRIDNELEGRRSGDNTNWWLSKSPARNTEPGAEAHPRLGGQHKQRSFIFGRLLCDRRDYKLAKGPDGNGRDGQRAHSQGKAGAKQQGAGQAEAGEARARQRYRGRNVALAPNCLDEGRVGRIGLDFTAEPRYPDIDGAVKGARSAPVNKSRS